MTWRKNLIKYLLVLLGAAYHTGTPVTIWADTTTLWSGAGSASCLIWLVRSS